jgi:hypothetical protein
MATIEELSDALLKADKAGNVDDARMFADEIVRLRQLQATPAPPEATPAEAPLPSAASEEAMIGIPETTAGGLAGAALRGAAPTITGAGAGGLVGAGIGLLGGPSGVATGANLGARAGAVLGPMADPIVAGINKLFGTNYTLPNEAVQHYLTQIGVPKPGTAAERITEAVTGGAVSGIGFNALAREVAKRATAGGLAQRVAQAMTTSTAESATAGAAAGLGGQLVQEAGGGPLAQFAGSLAGGFAGGAPFRGARPPSGRIEDDLALAIKGDKRAMQSVAEAGAADPTVRQAAVDLGLNVDEIPDFLLSKNPQFQAAAAAVGSAPGARLSVEKQNALEALKARAQSVIEQAGGTTDLSELNLNLSNKMESIAKTLEQQADDIYNVQIPKVLPAKTPVKLDNTVAAIERRLTDELGGDVGGLKKIERKILEIAQAKRKLTPQEIALVDAQIAPLRAQVAGGNRDPQLLNQIAQLEQSKNVMINTPPTYGRLKQERSEVGGLVRRGNVIEGLNDLDDGLAKLYYGTLTQDIDAAATAAGAQDLVNQANSLWSQFKDVSSARASLFGENLQRTVGEPLIRATRNLSKKGAYSEYAALINNMPQDMRQSAAVSSLAAAFGANVKDEAFNPTYFKKWYEGLQSNNQSKNVLFSNLPSETRSHLDNLYKIADNISAAEAKYVSTGRLQSAMQASETTIEKVYDAVVRSIKGLAAGSAAGVVAGPVVGSAVGGAIAASGNKQAIPLLIRADEFLLSPEFRKLVSTSQANPTAYTKAAQTAVNSTAFKRFADAVKLPQTQRNVAFLIGGKEEEPPQE